MNERDMKHAKVMFASISFSKEQKQAIQIMKQLTNIIGLSKDEADIAYLIVSLYAYGNHKMQDEDEGTHAVNYLFRKGEIRRFIEDKQDDEILEAAIFYHSKAFVDPHLPYKQHFFADLLRDCIALSKLRLRLEQNENKLILEEYSFRFVQSKTYAKQMIQEYSK